MHILKGDLHRFVEELWAASGSDLMLTEGSPPFVRVDGQLLRLDGEAPLTEEAITRLLHDVLDRDQLERFERHNDVDFAISWKSKWLSAIPRSFFSRSVAEIC